MQLSFILKGPEFLRTENAKYSGAPMPEGLVQAEFSLNAQVIF